MTLESFLALSFIGKRTITCLKCDHTGDVSTFAMHLKREHNLSTEEYFKSFVPQPKCICGSSTKFLGLRGGYRDYCSKQCSGVSRRTVTETENTEDS